MNNIEDNFYLARSNWQFETADGIVYNPLNLFFRLERYFRTIVELDDEKKLIDSFPNRNLVGVLNKNTYDKTKQYTLGKLPWKPVDVHAEVVEENGYFTLHVVEMGIEYEHKTDKSYVIHGCNKYASVKESALVEKVRQKAAKFGQMYTAGSILNLSNHNTSPAKITNVKFSVVKLPINLVITLQDVGRLSDFLLLEKLLVCWYKNRKMFYMVEPSRLPIEIYTQWQLTPEWKKLFETEIETTSIPHENLMRLYYLSTFLGIRFIPGILVYRLAKYCYVSEMDAVYSFPYRMTPISKFAFYETEQDESISLLERDSMESNAFYVPPTQLTVKHRWTKVSEIEVGKDEDDVHELKILQTNFLRKSKKRSGSF